MKSSIKSDRNWGPEDPMLQHQWHQINNKSHPENFDELSSLNGKECEESKNVKVIMKRLFTSSTPNNKNNPYKGNKVKNIRKVT